MKSKIERLIELNSKLDKVIEFELTDQDDLRKYATAGTGVAGVGALGAGGLYVAGARRQGVQWGNLGSKISRDISAGNVGKTFVRGAKYTGGLAKGLGTSALNFIKGIRLK